MVDWQSPSTIQNELGASISIFSIFFFFSDYFVLLFLRQAHISKSYTSFTESTCAFGVSVSSDPTAVAQGSRSAPC